MAHKMRVRKGDLVQVIAGKDLGKQGRVLDARPSDRRVVVENLNMVKRHQRPRPIQSRTGMTPTIREGGIIEKPAPLDISNVMLVCPVCNRPTRVGITTREIKGETVKIRVCKRADCHGEIDGAKR
jgi:large subunit ribosomal protein L24